MGNCPQKEQEVSSEETKASLQKSEPLTLIVGDAAAWLSAGRSLPDDPGLHYVSYEELSLSLLESLEPDIVLSPLLGEGFDALDVAAALEKFQFKGRFRALCPKLPNPSLVLKEVQNLCPSVDFDLFEIEERDTRRLN